MSEYKLIFTNVGLTKKQNAELGSNFIDIETFAVGDGVIFDLQPTLSGLVSEKYRSNINNVDTKNGTSTFDLIVPSTVGGFYVREVALFDVDGDCICIGTVPVTYKVAQNDGASKSLHLKVMTTSTNTEQIVFNTDESLLYATMSYVNTHIDDKTNPHQVTKAQVGLGNCNNTADNQKEVLSATKLKTPRTITLTGDVTGSTTFDGVANRSISVSVKNNSHSHTIANITGLQTALNNINAILSSDDTTLDEIQEVVDFIKQNRSDLENLAISNIAGLQTALNGKLGVNSNAVSATKLKTPRTITLTGDVTGSTTFDGTTNRSISVNVKDDSHNHVIANIDGLVAALNGKQPAGTYNTVIGTDSDINTSGATIIDNIYVTDGVITSMGTRALTPNDIGAPYIVASSYGVNGYEKWSNGKIEQWGVATGRGVFSFPIAFPNACLNIVITHKDYPGFTYEYPANWITNVTKNGAEVNGGFQASNDWYYRAIGY